METREEFQFRPLIVLYGVDSRAMILSRARQLSNIKIGYYCDTIIVLVDGTEIPSIATVQ